MSWDEHINTMKANGADEAAISAQDGNIWVKSSNFNATPQEIATMVKAAKGESIPDTEKLQIGGEALMMVDTITDHVGCKLITKGEGEKKLCIVGLTSTAAVITYKSGPNKNSALTACETEVKHLKENGL